MAGMDFMDEQHGYSCLENGTAESGWLKNGTGQILKQKQTAFLNPVAAKKSYTQNHRLNFKKPRPKNRLKKKKSEPHPAIYKKSP